jgi:hypothetical protein
MLAADVPVEQAHRHALRRTFGRLYMAAPKELSRLQRIIGYASPGTTSRHVHRADHELVAEHRRIERLQRRPTRPPRGASVEDSRRHGGVRSGEVAAAAGQDARPFTVAVKVVIKPTWPSPLGSCPQGQVGWRNRWLGEDG